MNTIAIIILTAFINVVVTSIVSNIIFLRYQKRIENSFATALFEHQTKFVRNHEKAVETLDALYKKYIVASQSIMNDTVVVSRIFLSPTRKGKDDFEGLHSFQLLDDYSAFFESNRLYLSDNINKEIRSIYQASYQIIVIVAFFFATYDNKQDAKRFLTINKIIENNKLGINKISWDEPNIKDFVEEVKEEINNKVLKIESIYKSVADITVESD